MSDAPDQPAAVQPAAPHDNAPNAPAVSARITTMKDIFLAMVSGVTHNLGMGIGDYVCTSEAQADFNFMRNGDGGQFHVTVTFVPAPFG